MDLSFKMLRFIFKNQLVWNILLVSFLIIFTGPLVFP